MNEMRILVIDEVHVKDAIGKFAESYPSVPFKLYEEWDLGRKADQDPVELITKAKDINPVIIVIGGSHVLGNFDVACELFKSAPALGYVIRAGVGIDHVNKRAAQEAGVRIINEPFGNNESAAEWTSRLILASLRQEQKDNYKEVTLPREIFRVPVEEFREGHDFRMRTKNQNSQIKEKLARDIEYILSPVTMPQIERLNGKQIGILGFGHIGSTLAGKLQQLKQMYKLNLKTLAYDNAGLRDLYVGKRLLAAAESFDVKFVESAERLLQEADIITVHISGVPENERFVNAQLLRGSNAELIVNISRDFIVDHEDMLSFLERSPKVKYFTDFAIGPYFNSPFSDRVVISNHVAGITRSANQAVWKNVGKIIVSILKDFIGEKSPKDYTYNIVNSPPLGGWRRND